MYADIPFMLNAYPVFAFNVNVIKLFDVTAVEAFVGEVTLTDVPQALPAGVPVLPRALPRVKPPIVILLIDVVGD